MSREEVLSALKGKQVDYGYLVRAYLIDKYPEKSATDIQQIVEGVGKYPHKMQEVVMSCLGYFEEKHNILRVFKNNQLITYA